MVWCRGRAVGVGGVAAVCLEVAAVCFEVGVLDVAEKAALGARCWWLVCRTGVCGSTKMRSEAVGAGARQAEVGRADGVNTASALAGCFVLVLVMLGSVTAYSAGPLARVARPRYVHPRGSR